MISMIGMFSDEQVKKAQRIIKSRDNTLTAPGTYYHARLAVNRRVHIRVLYFKNTYLQGGKALFMMAEQVKVLVAKLMIKILECVLSGMCHLVEKYIAQPLCRAHPTSESSRRQLKYFSRIFLYSKNKVTKISKQQYIQDGGILLRGRNSSIRNSYLTAHQTDLTTLTQDSS